MKKYQVVKEKRRFDYIINNSKYIKNDVFVIYYDKHEEKFAKFGIAVGKKIGNAVMRNKYKRIIRNLIDKNKLLFKNGFDYIIIIKKKCLDLSYNELDERLVSLIKEKI